MKKNIYIVSGFSGAGKTSLCKEALKNLENVELIKSYTTRLPRDEKDDGYHFISRAIFAQMELAGEFLETNFYNDNYYGTPLGDVRRCLEKGKSVVLEIDVHGCQKVLKCGVFDRENIHSIFVVTKADELSRRLCTRNTEDMEKIMRRMQAAVEESKMLDLYDVILENNDYLASVRKLEKFFMGEEILSDEFNKDFFVNEVEFLTHAYKRGIALQHNEYTSLEAYYEDREMHYEQLAVLGAAFTRELTSMGNYAQGFSVLTLLKMAVVLTRTKNNYNAEKIFKIAVNWAEEEQLVGSAQYPYLGQWIEDVRAFLEKAKKED